MLARRIAAAHPIVIRVDFRNKKIFCLVYGNGEFTPICVCEEAVRGTEIDMLPISSENSNSKTKSFVVQYHIRGRRKRRPLTTSCYTVQDVIELGQESFPAFADRNPWICIDSKHATVFVGLDPEREPQKSRVPDEPAVRNGSLNEESTEK
ncbi:MAG TPA: hypothetical protein VF283_22445 [Bryobacteraceae bacterium]